MGLRCLALVPLLAAAGASAATTELLSEDFHDFTANNSTDVSASLDGYTAVAGWSGSKVYCYSGRAKLGSGSATGWIATPPLDLSGDGVFRLSCTIEQYGSDVNTVDIDIGADGNGYTTLLTVTPTTNLVLDITNGTSASRIRFRTSDRRCYLDDLTVVRITDDTPTPPVWTLGDWTNVAATAGTAVSVDLLPYLSGNPAPELSLASGSGAVSSGAWTFTPAAAGSYTAVIAASNASGTATVTLAVTVAEPPPETAGELTFLTPAVSVTESSGALVAVVSREGGAAGAVTVAYATTDGTALAGSDYTAVSGVLSFPDGATSKSISVPILNDSVIESNETFSILLSSPTGGAVLGSNTVLVVTITDDDAPAPVDPNASYYASCYNADGTVKTGAALKAALCTIINTGVRTNSYASLNTCLDVTDAAPGNPSKVLCLYSQNAISQSSYNKEHIWAQSHGIDERAPAYSDLHHIRACTPTLNSTRGNLDFDNCRDVAGAKETSGNYYTSTAWEPPDAAKGDVARAMFYMDVRYEGRYNPNNNLTLVENIPTTTTGNDFGRLSTLIAWNELDPVSSFETNRNELIYRDYQKNRNPFIDHPEWVTAIYDPEHFIQSTNTYVLTVDCGTNGYVDPMTASVVAGTSQTFAIVPEQYYYISSIYQGSEQIAPYLYTNRSFYAHTWSVVTSDGVLAVRFSPQLAALGTPIYWLAELGYTDNFDAAELDDLNDDGIPPLAGISLRRRPPCRSPARARQPPRHRHERHLLLRRMVFRRRCHRLRRHRLRRPRHRALHARFRKLRKLHPLRLDRQLRHRFFPHRHGRLPRPSVQRRQRFHRHPGPDQPRLHLLPVRPLLRHHRLASRRPDVLLHRRPLDHPSHRHQRFHRRQDHQHQPFRLLLADHLCPPPRPAHLRHLLALRRPRHRRLRRRLHHQPRRRLDRSRNRRHDLHRRRPLARNRILLHRRRPCTRLLLARLRPRLRHHPRRAARPRAHAVPDLARKRRHQPRRACLCRIQRAHRRPRWRWRSELRRIPGRHRPGRPDGVLRDCRGHDVQRHAEPDADACLGRPRLPGGLSHESAVRADDQRARRRRGGAPGAHERPGDLVREYPRFAARQLAERLARGGGMG